MAVSKAGAVGCILLMPAAIMLMISGFLAGGTQGQVIMFGISGMIFFVGFLLASIGSMKLGKYYKSPLPKVAGIIGLIAAIIGLVTTMLWLVGWLALILALVQALPIMLYLTGILYGVFFVLLGISFLILMNKTGVRALAVVAGILAIVAGNFAFLFGVGGILWPIFGIMLMPAAIIVAIVFLKAKGGVAGVEVTEAKKPVIRLAEAKPKKSMKPEEIEAGVYKYVKQNPEGIDLAECAKGLGVSEGEVEKAVNALVKKGKLESG